MTDFEAKVYNRRVRRGRRWWDLVSPVHGSAGGATSQVAELALGHLGLREGDAVLDLGCGSGAALPSLSRAVGAAGRVVGLDNSPRMLAIAGKVVSEHELQNVELRCGDASCVEIEPAGFDAVYACSSLSAVPDVPAALATVRRALKPGGQLFVLDVRLKPAGWSAPVIWLFQRLYAVSAGWAGVDVLDSARVEFGDVVVPDLPGRSGRPQPTAGWPPVTTFVATKL